MLHSTLPFNQIHPTYDSKFQGEWGLDPLIKAVSVVVTDATQLP